MNVTKLFQKKQPGPEILLRDGADFIGVFSARGRVASGLAIVRKLSPGHDFAYECVADPLFETGFDHWSLSGEERSGLDLQTHDRLYRLNGGGHTLFMRVPPKAEASMRLTYSHPVFGDKLPVEAGSLVEIDCLAASHRSDSYVNITFFDEDDIELTTDAAKIEKGHLGGQLAEKYRGVRTFFTAPEAATKFSIAVTKPSTQEAQSGYMFLAKLSVVVQPADGDNLVTDTPLPLRGSQETIKLARVESRAALDPRLLAQIEAAPEGYIYATDSGEPGAAGVSPILSPDAPVWRIDLGESKSSVGLPMSAVEYVRSAALNAGQGLGLNSTCANLTNASQLRVMVRGAGTGPVTLVSTQDDFVLRHDFVLENDWQEVSLDILPGAQPSVRLEAVSAQAFVDVAYVGYCAPAEAAPGKVGLTYGVGYGAQAAPSRFDPANYRDGMVVVTPTGDRPRGFALLMKWMRQQTRQPDQWLIIDDGQVPMELDTIAKLPPYARYIRRTRQPTDYPHTLANQLAFGLEHAEYDKLLVMEDDDWYAPTYVAFMEEVFPKGDLIGLNSIHYYHWYSRQWKKGRPQANTSLAQSGFHARAFQHLHDICNSDTPGVRASGLVDRFMWRTFPGKQYIVREHPTLNVGMKGTPGRAGIAEGHLFNDKDYKPDQDFGVLTSMIGEDIHAIITEYGRVLPGVIYTAMSGGLDFISDPEHVIDGVDYICYTDAPSIKSRIWQVRPLPDMGPDVAPVRRAKRPKILPHHFFPDHQWSLWIDANIRIRSSLENLLIGALQDGDLIGFKHPDRDCLYEESVICKQGKKDDESVIDRQIERYLEEGFPRKFGMTECNVLFRRHNNPKVKDAMDLWWKEVSQGSKRDQLSYTYAHWKAGLPHLNFEGSTKLRDFRAMDRKSHFFNEAVPGAQVVYAAESKPLSEQRVSSAQGVSERENRHTATQILPVSWRSLTAISFKVATHQGRALSQLTVQLDGVDRNGAITPLRKCVIEKQYVADNRYAVAKFEEVDCSNFLFVRVTATSMARQGRRPLSFYHAQNDPMSPSSEALRIDGHPVKGTLYLALQGFALPEEAAQRAVAAA